MKAIIAFAIVMTVSFSASAATKRIDCTQTSSKGDVMYVHATISDGSDNAEVQAYLATAPCAKDKSCDTDVYKKDILPTVMRLTHRKEAGEMSLSDVMDINRATLEIVTRQTLEYQGAVVNSVDFTGTCTVNVEKTKNIL